MRALFLVGLSSIAALTVGCSTHPLPEDFSRQKTTAIVKHMRCEISEGIRKIPNATSQQLAYTLVGFDFTLTMTEDNKVTEGELGFLSPIHNGEFKVKFGGGAAKQRKNERGFRIVDTFKNLALEEGCTADERRANFVYPVAGRIGLSEVVATYWDLKKNYEFKLTDTDRAFIDKLTFTTILEIGITPSITLTAGNGNFRLTNATMDGSTTRTDVHEITIAVIEATPPPRSPTPPVQHDGKKRTNRKLQIPDLNASGRIQIIESPVNQPGGAARKLNRLLDRELDRDSERRFLER